MTKAQCPAVWRPIYW